ncbi:MAG: RNA polymerase sigma factor [bacterium]
MDSDRDLFWKLVEPEHRRLAAFCRKLTGNRDEGDDLCQDALVTAIGGFDSIRNQSSFRPWLYRIVVNTFLNRSRQVWRRKESPLTPEQSETLGGQDPSNRHAARRILETAFKAVSEEDRAMLTLFALDGWTVAELAQMFGMSESAIKVRLHRIRRKMQERLTKQLARSVKSLKSTTVSEAKTCIALKPDAS